MHAARVVENGRVASVATWGAQSGAHRHTAAGSHQRGASALRTKKAKLEPHAQTKACMMVSYDRPVLAWICSTLVVENGRVATAVIGGACSGEHKRAVAGSHERGASVLAER